MSASRNSAVTLFGEPLGLPAGFPDCPLGKGIVGRLFFAALLSLAVSRLALDFSAL
jgi:hypothetical protein